MTGSDWEFQAGDEIEKAAEFRIFIGEEQIDHARYTVNRRLEDVDSKGRYYFVMDEFGETQLYGADTLEGTYRSLHTESDRQ